MIFRILTSIKRWWRNHRWVDVRDSYIIPHKNLTFWLSDEEMQQAEKFKKDHKATFYQYCFTPGSIGVGLKIIGDGAEQDITDYRSW